MIHLGRTLGATLALRTVLLTADPLTPGDHTRTLQVDGRERSYLVHVPPQCDPKQATPIVLVFHGTADSIVPFSGPSGRTPKFLTFKSVEETIRLCAKTNGCPETPTEQEA